MEDKLDNLPCEKFPIELLICNLFYSRFFNNFTFFTPEPPKYEFYQNFENFHFSKAIFSIFKNFSRVRGRSPPEPAEPSPEHNPLTLRTNFLTTPLSCEGNEFEI